MRRGAYEPSLISVETTRTGPPPYEISSLLNADAPVSPQYCGTALVLESPQPSVFASSSFYNEELHASSSQRVKEVTTPPAQPKIERHESGMAPHRSEPIQRAFSSPDPSQPLQSLDGLAAQPSQIQRSQFVQASHRYGRTTFTKPGENIGWRGYEP